MDPDCFGIRFDKLEKCRTCPDETKGRCRHDYAILQKDWKKEQLWRR